VHALAGQRVDVRRQGGHQRLALAGSHLGDLAVVQRGAADQLHVEVAHAHGAAGRLADDGKGLGDQGLKLGAGGQALSELGSLGPQGLVGKGLEVLLELADLLGEGTIAAHDALAAAAKYTRQILEHWPLEPRNFGNRNNMTPWTEDSSPPQAVKQSFYDRPPPVARAA